MRRISVIIYLLIAITVFSSCSHFNNGEKLDMYNKISATNDTLDKMTKGWHELLFKAASDKNYSVLAPYRLKMGEFLSKHRNDIANLKVSADDASLIDSEITFLSTRATAISNVYPRFEAFNEVTPFDVVRKELMAIANDLDTEMAGNAAIKKSLHAFAIRNELKNMK